MCLCGGDCVWDVEDVGVVGVWVGAGGLVGRWVVDRTLTNIIYADHDNIHYKSVCMGKMYLIWT